MIKKFIFIVLTGFSIVARDDKKIEHYEWWQEHLGNAVSFEEFASWLGDINAPSRRAMRMHVKNQNYTSLLDIPCGLCVDYFGLMRDIPSIKYQGIDITQKLIDRAQAQNINVMKGNIENISCADNNFDIAYARHILEHLPYYQQAINELLRVARKEVLIVFHIRPTDKNDVINYENISGSMLYQNHYNRQKLEAYILSCKNVKSISWENPDMIHFPNETILHIYKNY